MLEWSVLCAVKCVVQWVRAAEQWVFDGGISFFALSFALKTNEKDVDIAPLVSFNLLFEQREMQRMSSRPLSCPIFEFSFAAVVAVVHFFFF